LLEVHESDARTTLDTTRELLRERPAENNMLWQILADQAGQSRYGRYWWVAEGGVVLGAAVHFPPRARAMLTPMSREVAVAAAQSIRPPLPGITAEPATAAAFAAAWTTRHLVSARAVDTQLLYRLSTIGTPTIAVPGSLRRATPSDRDLLVKWTRTFGGASSSSAPRGLVDRALARGEAWLWQHDEPVAMAMANRPVGGVSRVHAVFTPPGNRGRGYGTAVVDGLSRHLVKRGLQCTLETRLTNPGAHTVYRRIGYEPIGEILAFRWES
jgi:ribosomal protein S18 acetylase RimI-like enzyme